MPQVERAALVGFSASQMYALVNDVERYPQFLPGCGGARLLSASDTELMATIDIAKAGMRAAFTTRNRMVPGRSIELTLVNGPFRTLHGHWLFQPVDEQSCRVSLSLRFEFSNPLLALALGGVFQQMAVNMVDAFRKRAAEVYGG
ncbi:MAG: type II toxin-antitoxin system RatA family toxin [Gammaproteobacteria bacterium]|jgi:ribosome-associated toxin RatA of RatAB toxin-antitoxin module|nr:type II toxin-antitoxin system RatA family toxin [Gammaproteobacteria bacterium]